MPDKQLEQREATCGASWCGNLRDPRCVGLNCTEHCVDPRRCNGACLRIWERNVVNKANDAEFLKTMGIAPDS